MIAGEFLADGVFGGAVVEIRRAGPDAGVDLFAEWEEITSRDDDAELIRDHTRRAEVIGCRVGDLCFLDRCDVCRILRDQLACGIDENCGFLIGDFLYPLAFAIVEIVSDDVVVGILDLCLLVVAVEYERPRLVRYGIDVADDIAIFVVTEPLSAVEPISRRIDRRIRSVCDAADVLRETRSVAVAII